MEHKSYDLRNLQEIGQGDEVFIREMMISFIENVTIDIEKIRNSRALKDWTTVAQIAHKMVPRFAYLSANHLHVLSADIEKSVLIDNNLIGIAEKTDEFCDGCVLLIEELKNDFDFLRTN